jgi:hypothetical protein
MSVSTSHASQRVGAHLQVPPVTIERAGVDRHQSGTEARSNRGLRLIPGPIERRRALLHSILRATTPCHLERMLQRSVLLAIAFTLILHVQPASAQDLRQSAAVLADASRIVLTGRVSSVEARADAGLIYTYATVEVAELLKGELTTSTIVVKQLGGTLPNIGLYISDQAVLRANEQALLFLAVRPRDGTLTTTSLARGKWPLVTDLASGALTAAMDSQAIALDDSLRATIAASRPRTEPFVITPPEFAGSGVARPAFSYIPTNEGGPARWHEADEGRPIPVDYQDATDVGILDIAIGTWNGVNTTLDLQRAQGGPAVCPAVDFSRPGTISFYWNDPCGEIADDGSFGVGGGFFTPGFQKTINGTTFNGFVQGLAILNNTGPHLGTNVGCLRDAAIHVIGHAVGLGHGAGGSVMQATLRGGCNSGTSGLASDDINGLRSIYPAFPGGGHPPNPPTAINASVVLDTVSLSWTAATTGGAAQSYILEAGSAPGLANIATFTLNGTGTSTVVGAVPSGVYWVRVRARNFLGTSGPSPDRQVIVGPCSAPGPPSGLSYTSADNLVTLNWNPPASGVAQGYWLFAGFSPGASDALVMPLGPAPTFSAVAPFGNYYVRVAARNSCATGPVTADVLVSVVPCTAPPAAPTGLTFTRSGNIVTLSWTAPASGNPPSSYDIIVGSVSGGADLLSVNTGGNATSFVASAPPGQYFVRVGSRNNCTGANPPATSNELQIVVP